ncbi:MAG: hypothetical protein ACPHTD_01345 [Gammaproteobacteria bacterium]
MSTKEVELERDHYWWLHPALRGQQSLGTSADALPWRWVDASESDAGPAVPALAEGTYGDFAKLLYKLNGYRPGPVSGWYVIVCPEPDRYAVGQLCVDPEVPVRLFREHVYRTEAEAREVASALRAESPGLLHRV